MNDLITQYVTHNHFGSLLGMNFKIIAPGEAAYFLEISQRHLATPFHAHGGCISALADACMGVGALSLVQEHGKVVSTLEFKISFFQTVKESEFITGRSIVKKLGKTIIFMEANIYNRNEELIAHSTGTFKAYDANKAGFKFEF
ncbi:MAG: PaaI family thioesterase [Flavobacteriales bacterium]|nr:PaaI family thioesterase [Flavobacteriales bacterium]